MALFGRSKNKDVKKAPKEENVLDMVKEHDHKAVDNKPGIVKEDTGRAHRVLMHHHLSEKTNQFSQNGRYVFKVLKSTNKIEVKKAVEKVYDVHVVKVNMINTQGKLRRQGQNYGRTQNWKKAIVTLKAGERITGLAEGV